MKIKIIAVFLSAILILSLGACGESAKDNTVETPVVSEESDEVLVEPETVTEPEKEPETTVKPGPAVEDALTHGDLFEVYSEVLKDAFNVTYIGTEPVSSGLGSMQAEIMYMEDEQKDSVGYTFEDINGDGTCELIIGCTNCSSTLYALYTYDNSGIKLLGSGGYRTALSIYEQGYFVCEGSSGAANYSYEIYKLEGTKEVLKDFFFTDFKDGSMEEIGYFHNKTGEWDISLSEELTEQAFAVCSEMGLEQLDYNGRFTPLSALKDYYGGTHTGVSVDELNGECTWLLQRYVIGSKEYFAESNGIIQSIYFTEGNTVNFNRTENGKDVIDISDIEISEYDNHINFYYVDYDANTSLSITLYRLEQDGTLMAQRCYFDDAGYHIINEYYMRTVG